MTLWNPLNVFAPARRNATGDGVSASFDPPRHNAPAGPDGSSPTIGVGGSSVGSGPVNDEPTRNPIGFAPADDDGEPRFRTELSFKRHFELPRASSTSDGSDDGTRDSWRTPDEIDAESGAAEGLSDEANSGSSLADESPEKVPFYKREIGFRRKSASPEPSPEPADVDEAEADATVEDREIDPVTASSVPDLDDQTVALPSEAVALEELAAGYPGDRVAEVDSSAAKVPFYKREISLRRKNVDPATEPAELDLPSEEVSSEDASNSAQYVLPESEAATEQFGSDDLVADAPAVDAWEIEASEEPVEDVVPVVAFAGHDAVTAEVDLDDLDDLADREDTWEADDLFVEDEPPKGRSSRKDKVAKAPKRKATRGGGTKGRRVVGLKIGASQIAAAVVVETDGSHELVELVRRPLAAGIVVDGEVKDPDALSNALKAFFADEKLPKKDVRIGLASNRIGVRTFDIVGIDDEARFDNAVRFKAHEVLPVAAHESVLDYRVLDERPNETGEPTRRVLLVVAPKDQVQPYVDVAQKAGIKLAGIDLEALGLLRAFVDPKPYAVRAVDDTATVVVSIGHESSTLLVAGGGACEFTRVFDWGGAALVDAIASELEVPPAEAVTILKHLSLSGPGRQFDGLDEAGRVRAVDAVRLRLTPFARELVNSLQFYQTQDESLGIGGIVITGGTSQLEGLGEALNQMIGVNVSVGDPLSRVSVAAEIDLAIDGSLGSMAVPIGLAIDDLAMRGVDLLPKDATKKRSPKASMVAFGAPVAVAVPLVVLGFLYLGAHGKAGDKQAELDAVKAEIAALPQPVGPELDASIVGNEAARATAVARVLGGRVAWDAVFRDMSRILPTNVWLTSLSASAPEIADPAGAAAAVAATVPGQTAGVPTAVAIEGYTFSQPDVARLLARLATLPSLKRVTLTSSQKETVGTKNVVRFSIVADLSQTGGAS